MQENTNKAIAINSAIMYFRLAIISIAGLLTTRFALQALGVTDFGLFSVVGSVITLIGFINSIMISTSNRFIAFAIGKGIKDEINNVFNVNLSIHVLIAAITMLIAYPLGDWYIINYIHFDGDINLAIKVYNITVIGSIVSFIGVPYSGLLIAKERFFVFCFVDVFSHAIKVFATYLLLSVSSDRLFLYACIVMVTTALPTLAYMLYCHISFKDICSLKIVKNLKYYKDVFGFSIWIAYGAMAYVGQAQGTALVMNAFFNTVVNTALGIAGSVNSILLMFANNISKSITPQITKSYARGDYDRCTKLLVVSSKSSFLMMLLVSLPFIICADFVFELWLGEVPDYLVVFVHLIIVNSLVNSLNVSIVDVVFASGKIKLFQFVTNSLLIISIFISIVILKIGLPAHSLYYVYIAFSILIVITRQILLQRVYAVDTMLFIKKVYIPIFFVLLLSSPMLFLKDLLNPVISMVLSLLYLVIVIYCVGIDSKERSAITEYIKKRLNVECV